MKTTRITTKLGQVFYGKIIQFRPDLGDISVIFGLDNTYAIKEFFLKDLKEFVTFRILNHFSRMEDVDHLAEARKIYGFCPLVNKMFLKEYDIVTEKDQIEEEKVH